MTFTSRPSSGEGASISSACSCWRSNTRAIDSAAARSSSCSSGWVIFSPFSQISRASAAQALEELRAGPRGDLRLRALCLGSGRRHQAPSLSSAGFRGPPALALGLDRLGVEAEVRARRQDPPHVGRVRVVRPLTRLVVGLELLDVAEDLDEAILLGNANVAAQIARRARDGAAPRRASGRAGQGDRRRL